MKNKKAFTLIELIAVLVIMAILALIVTPLVLNIVRNAKDSANKRSVDAYGKSIELAVATYLLDTGDFPTSIEELTIEYTGKEVVCGVQQLNKDSSVYLSECTIGGKEVKDSDAEDGWYHYGKADKITYQAYSIGDEITYNGMNFYVIADSDENSDSVTMLKAEPLTVDEVNTYGRDHVNRYTHNGSAGTAWNQNGYGGMAYYSSEFCRYASAYIETGCTTDYTQSDIKYVIDAWASDKLKANDLSIDETGYSVRLITYDELSPYLENDNLSGDDSVGYHLAFSEDVPDWLYNSNYRYWTMSTYKDSDSLVWFVSNRGAKIYMGFDTVVRPVITIKKSAI